MGPDQPRNVRLLSASPRLPPTQVDGREPGPRTHREIRRRNVRKMSETQQGVTGYSRNPLKNWSGRPDSNRRRPAWEAHGAVTACDTPHVARSKIPRNAFEMTRYEPSGHRKWLLDWLPESLVLRVASSV